MNSVWIAVALVALFTTGLEAQTGPLADSTVVVERMADHLYRIECRHGDDQVSTVASIGPDGIFLVDGGYAVTAERLMATIGELAAGADFKYFLLTHMHNDHTGAIGSMDSGMTFMTHPATAERLRGNYYALAPIYAVRQPDRLVSAPESLTFNGEEILIWPVSGAHTEGDLIVYFTGSGVLCLGDLFFSEQIDFIDFGAGGRPSGYTENLEHLCDTLPADLTVVAGHGPVTTLVQLRDHVEMLHYCQTVVSEGVRNGLTDDALLLDSGLARWVSWSGPHILVSYQTLIPTIRRELESHSDLPPSVCEPLTRAIVERGIEAAVAEFHQILSEKPDAYTITEVELNMLGYQLLFRQMLTEAISIFGLNVELYPRSANAYDSMGEACLAAGDKEAAIWNYEKSLELDPTNQNAATVLGQIRSGE